MEVQTQKAIDDNGISNDFFRSGGIDHVATGLVAALSLSSRGFPASARCASNVAADTLVEAIKELLHEAICTHMFNAMSFDKNYRASLCSVIRAPKCI